MMRVLVTGGTGKTGSAIVRGLLARGATPRIGSRQPQTPRAGCERVRFDWADPDCHDLALRGCDAVYMIAPANVPDPARLILPFIDRAIAHGVERFVQLSSSAFDERTPGFGEVHAALRTRAPAWTVLRPSWFMTNFTDPDHALGRAIREERALVTASGAGRVGFIDPEDIAAVAVACMFAPANAAPILTGPAALSYDEAAEIVSAALGERVVHRSIPVDAWQRRLVASGMPAEYAALLGALELAIAGGSEDRTTDEVLRHTGRPPRSFEEFAPAAFRR